MRAQYLYSVDVIKAQKKYMYSTVHVGGCY